MKLLQQPIRKNAKKWKFQIILIDQKNRPFIFQKVLSLFPKPDRDNCNNWEWRKTKKSRRQVSSFNFIWHSYADNSRFSLSFKKKCLKINQFDEDDGSDDHNFHFKKVLIVALKFSIYLNRMCHWEIWNPLLKATVEVMASIDTWERFLLKWI